MRLRTFMVAALTVAWPLTQGCMITNRDIESLREQVRLNQKSTADAQKKVEEHSMRLEGIDNSLQMLEARVDDNSERIENLKAGIIAGTAQPPVVVEAAPPAVPSGGTQASPAYTTRPYTRGEDLYNSAYGYFEKGQYGQAILEFEEYVANYGATELGDNAQYWIGECYYAQKDYRQAVREFEKVEKNFPRGNKVPAAKLKKGLAYRELGNNEEAVKELKEVVAKYPDAEEVPLAKEKLKLWK